MNGRLHIVNPETEEILHFQSWTKKKYINVLTDFGVKENFIDYINHDTLELFQVHFSYGLPAISYFSLINNDSSDYFDLLSRLSTTNELFWGNTSFPERNLYMIKTFRNNNFIEPDNFNNYIPFLKILATHALFPLEMQHDIESEIYESITDQMFVMNYITLSLKDNLQSIASEIIEYFISEYHELYSSEKDAIKTWVATLIKNDRIPEANSWLDILPSVNNKNHPKQFAWKNNSCPNYSITSKSIFNPNKSHSDSDIPSKSRQDFLLRK